MRTVATILALIALLVVGVGPVAADTGAGGGNGTAGDRSPGRRMHGKRR